ncbi:MAG TPA: 30S ribosome-binding factor RbfA [Polyangiaceae bacterium]
MAKSEKWSRDGSARVAGFRSLRLEELFREEMNSLLDGEVTDPRLEDTHVTRVELSRDGSRARIWFTKTAREGAPSADETRAAFEHAHGFFRSRLCDALSLRRMPDLTFRHDPALAPNTDPKA